MKLFSNSPDEVMYGCDYYLFSSSKDDVRGVCVCVCVCVCVLVTQSCLTLCDPMDCNLPGTSVHGILQARTLEWVAISFSKRQCKYKV